MYIFFVHIRYSEINLVFRDSASNSYVEGSDVPSHEAGQKQ